MNPKTLFYLLFESEELKMSKAKNNDICTCMAHQHNRNVHLEFYVGWLWRKRHNRNVQKVGIGFAKRHH